VNWIGHTKFFVSALLALFMILSVCPAQRLGADRRNPDDTSIQDHSVIIKSTAEPEFPSEIVTDVELAVTLIATFKKSGKVTDVKVISSRVPAFIRGTILTKLEQATVDAAKKIQFVPATKKGHRISQRLELLFTFKRQKTKKFVNWEPTLIAE
jgi:hypothetical protein